MSNARLLAELSSADAGFRNKILNGCFDVWQRGTSQTGAYVAFHNYYGADRWQMFRAGGAAGATFSRVAYNGPNALSACRMQRNSGDTSTATLNITQSMESIDVFMLKGKTVTLSFRYLTGANFSGPNVAIFTSYGTGTDGNMAAGFTNGLTVPSGSKTVPASTTQRYETMTFTIPTNASQFGIGFAFGPTGTAGANDYVEITNVQLEVGSFATPFAHRPLAQEVMLCQRYYERIYYRIDAPTSSAAYFASATLPFKVLKRTGNPQTNRLGEALTAISWNSTPVSDTSAIVIYGTAASGGNAVATLEVNAEL